MYCIYSELHPLIIFSHCLTIQSQNFLRLSIHSYRFNTIFAMIVRKAVLCQALETQKGRHMKDAKLKLLRLSESFDKRTFERARCSWEKKEIWIHYLKNVSTWFPAYVPPPTKHLISSMRGWKQWCDLWLTIFLLSAECRWDVDFAGVSGGFQGGPFHCTGTLALWWPGVGPSQSGIQWVPFHIFPNSDSNNVPACWLYWSS